MRARRVYWVGKGRSSRWTDSANWSASSGGREGFPAPREGWTAVLDEGSGDGIVDLSGCSASLSISGFRGEVVMPNGGRVNFGHGRGEEVPEDERVMLVTIDVRSHVPSECPFCGEAVEHGDVLQDVFAVAENETWSPGMLGVDEAGAVDLTWTVWSCPNGHIGPALSDLPAFVSEHWRPE